MWLRQFNTGGRSKCIDNHIGFVAPVELPTSRRNSSDRADDETYFSAVPAVDIKIAVQREHMTGLVQFRHAYQAGISKQDRPGLMTGQGRTLAAADEVARRAERGGHRAGA